MSAAVYLMAGGREIGPTPVSLPASPRGCATRQAGLAPARTRASHQVGSLRLREGDHLTDVRLPGAASPAGQYRACAVRRRAVLERFQHVTSALWRHSSSPISPKVLLDGPVVDTDAAASDLVAVAGQIVLLAACLAGLLSAGRHPPHGRGEQVIWDAAASSSFQVRGKSITQQKAIFLGSSRRGGGRFRGAACLVLRRRLPRRPPRRATGRRAWPPPAR